MEAIDPDIAALAHCVNVVTRLSIVKLLRDRANECKNAVGDAESDPLITTAAFLDGLANEIEEASPIVTEPLNPARDALQQICEYYRQYDGDDWFGVAAYFKSIASDALNHEDLRYKIR